MVSASGAEVEDMAERRYAREVMRATLLIGAKRQARVTQQATAD